MARNPKLSMREVATILAGLRERQARLERPFPKPGDREAMEDIATNGGELEPLSSVEIDKLCERIIGA